MGLHYFIVAHAGPSINLFTADIDIQFKNHKRKLFALHLNHPAGDVLVSLVVLRIKLVNVYVDLLVFTHIAGVPVYLAPWTGCPPPPRVKSTTVGLPPGGKLSRDILPPTLVIFTPGDQAVQAGLSCPPPNTSKNIYI